MRTADPITPLGRRVVGVARRLRELATIVRVILTMVVVEATIRWQPLPRLARWLGCQIDLAPWPTPLPPPILLDELAPADRRRLHYTQLVADVWPHASGPCLRRALVGGHLLRAQHPSIRIGVIDRGGTIGAHAWLEIDNRPLEDVSEYQVFEAVARSPREAVEQ